VRSQRSEIACEKNLQFAICNKMILQLVIICSISNQQSAIGILQSTINHQPSAIT